MESSPADDRPSSEERIDSLINEYFNRRKTGEKLTPRQFAAEHPEAGEQLTPYLKGLSLLGGVSAGGDAGVGWGETTTGDLELPTIAGFVIHEEIGYGGMGIVYKALQVSTKRIVALKVMLAGPFASPSVRQRFKREVELAARLQHPHIVRVLESGRVGRQLFYAMDYVDGVPIDRYLRSAEPDRKAILEIVRRICDAVEYAHGHGVVHRDLKPANVLIDSEGEPHILDFGLAKAVDQADAERPSVTRASDPGQVIGTLPYLSPEQAGGRPEEIDTRTDVYSLGVMLYEMITGSAPFDMAGRPSEVIRRILEEPPKSPSSFPGWRDGELETIILKALEKEKDRRYQSARELGEDLRRYLEDEPILARRPSSMYILRKKLRKHRVFATIVVLLALVASVVIFVLGVESREQRRVLANNLRTALSMQLNIRSGDIDQHVGQLQSWAGRFPQQPEFTLILAQVLYHCGRQADAIRHLEGILIHEPGRWDCRALLSEIYRASGDVERADSMLASLEEEAPDTAEAWYLRSLATLDLSEAIRCAQEAVARNSSHTMAWYRLTYLYVFTEELDEALKAADRLLAIDEHLERSTTLKGSILALQGRFEEAIEMYERAMRLDPTGPAGSPRRAHARRRLKDYEGAIEDYTHILKGQGGGGLVWYYYQRATPLWIVGRTEEALEDYRTVRILLGRPHFSDVRRCLILRHEGRDAEARQVLDAALRDVRDHEWLRRVLCCLDGQITPVELVADAVEQGLPERLCEAYYYAGELSLLAEEPDKAHAYFRQCVGTGVEFDRDTELGTPMNEFELAQWRLETLFAADPGSSASGD